MPSRRHQSRIAVMQSLFELESRAVDPGRSLQHTIAELGAENVDHKFCQSLLEGVVGYKDQICLAVSEHAPQWPLARMDTISRCILMIGAYELLYANDAPPAVVMNEAIEIAKEFGNEESPKFVNGVLNALAHSKRSVP